MSSSKVKNKASFRDPAGHVFSQGSEVYRQVNHNYRKHYDFLFDSQLYKELTEANLLIPHQEVDFESTDENQIDDKTAYKFCKPTKVPFISYPYEWCFSQLKDAALATLEIQSIALKHGMSLKDASAYNIQFVNNKPILIDTLSFEMYVEGSMWIAYRQFCEHFLVPLVLMSTLDVRLGTLSREYINGIPLDLACRMLPKLTLMRPSLSVHLGLHALAQTKPEGTPEHGGSKPGSFSKASMLGLIDSLQSAVKGLKLTNNKSNWTNYYEDNNYTDDAQTAKREIVSNCLDQIKPQILWDMGANTGAFSALSAAKNIQTMSMDFDHNCVEMNYIKSKEKGVKTILPLLMDITQPTPSIGWANQERQSLGDRGNADVILALALVHHIAIANNVPLSDIASYFSTLSKYLIVEFITKDDSQVKRLLASRKDIFEEYDTEGFEKSFSQYYTIESKFPIAGTARTVYLMKRVSA